MRELEVMTELLGTQQTYRVSIRLALVLVFYEEFVFYADVSKINLIVNACVFDKRVSVGACA